MHSPGICRADADFLLLASDIYYRDGYLRLYWVVRWVGHEIAMHWVYRQTISSVLSHRDSNTMLYVRLGINFQSCRDTAQWGNGWALTIVSCLEIVVLGISHSSWSPRLVWNRCLWECIHEYTQTFRLYYAYQSIKIRSPISVGIISFFWYFRMKGCCIACLAVILSKGYFLKSLPMKSLTSGCIHPG